MFFLFSWWRCYFYFPLETQTRRRNSWVDYRMGSQLNPYCLHNVSVPVRHQFNYNNHSYYILHFPVHTASNYLLHQLKIFRPATTSLPSSVVAVRPLVCSYILSMVTVRWASKHKLLGDTTKHFVSQLVLLLEWAIVLNWRGECEVVGRAVGDWQAWRAGNPLVHKCIIKW